MILKKVHHNVLSPKGMQLLGGLLFLLLSLFLGLFDVVVVLVAALITLRKRLFSNPYLLWDLGTMAHTHTWSLSLGCAFNACHKPNV
jgi:hypothetical protein